MSSISMRTDTISNYETAKVQQAPSTTKDNIIEVKDGKIDTKDLQGAINSKKGEVFFSITDAAGKVSVKKIDLTENPNALKNLMTEITANKDFKLDTNVKFAPPDMGGVTQDLRKQVVALRTDGLISKDDATQIKTSVLNELKNDKMTPKQAQNFLDAYLNNTNATASVTSTKVNGKVEYKVTIESGDNMSPKVAVYDKEKIATADSKAGKDPQFKALNDNELNYLEFDDTGVVKGVNKFSGTPENPVKLPLDEKTMVGQKMSNVILNDFTRYAKSPNSLADTFPNTEKGLADFTKSLKNLEGNENNKNLTPANVKELLSYIHTGQNTSGKSNVQQLQGLLNNLTGDTGKVISDKNNPPGGDNKYGYATTLQVRSLASALQPVQFEVSGSFQPKTYDKAVILSDVSSSTANMRTTQQNKLMEKTELYGSVVQGSFIDRNQPARFHGNDASQINADATNPYDAGSARTMDESAILASTQAFTSQLADLKPGQTALISSFVDTNDSTSWSEVKALQDMVKKAALPPTNNKIDITFTYVNSAGAEKHISLMDIKDSHVNDGNNVSVIWADIPEKTN